MTAVMALGRRIQDRWLFVALFVLLALPLVIAVVALRGDTWYPVLDLAMTEFRVRDVGTGDTPLIGLPGRIGDLPEQGSHPGPLSFWLVAPTYRLLGSTPYAMEIGTVVVHLVVIGLALWVGRRLGGRIGMLLAAVVLAVAMRGYGTLLLIQPWNPYLPLLAWLLVLFSTWAVLAGHHNWLVAVAAAGTLCAQTHIPYLLLCGGMFLLAAGTVAVRARRGHEDGWRPLAIAGVVGAALWLPPVFEELGGGQGNITRLLDYFTSPPEDPVGFGTGVKLLVRHLNVVDGFFGLVHGSQRFMSVGLEQRSATWPGVVVLVLWVVAAIAAWRWSGSRPLRTLHAVIAVGLVLSVVSMARIFGTTWYYLTLWAWGLAALVLVSIVWTALALIDRAGVSWRSTARLGVAAFGALVLVLSTVLFSVDATDAEHPEANFGEQFAPLIEPTLDAVNDGVGAASGPDGRYLVQWSDAHVFGSQVYGLINELHRRGLDVGGPAYFTVPLTSELTMSPDEATAELHFASGAYVDDWRAVPEAVEVATHDPRTPDERRRYRELHDVARASLRRDGLDELLPLLERNVFSLATNDRISIDTRKAASEMLQIGTELAVFVIPTGTVLPA